MIILGYVSIILMGFVIGLMGGGGSILTVPILVYLFGMNPLAATGHSLFVVGITALSGGFSYLKRNEVDLKLGLIFAVPGFFSVLLSRAVLLPNLPDPILSVSNINISKSLFIMIFFASLMLVASYSMIKSRSFHQTRGPLSGFDILKVIAYGFMVGSMTGFVGSGGGFLIIPALVNLVKLPMKVAVGTSLFIIATNSLVGFAGDIQYQAKIEWWLLAKFLVLAFCGLLVGINVSKRVSDKNLRRWFGFFILVMGLAIIVEQLSHLY